MDFDQPSRPGPSDPSDRARNGDSPLAEPFDPQGGSWFDPEEERWRSRSRLRRLGFGFSTLALALILASLSAIGFLLLFFTGRIRNPGLLLGIDHWELILETAIVWVSTIGVALIWGRWPDASWTRRSGLLLMMCLADVVLWSLDHAKELGLSNAQVGHDWFRISLGRALGWSEFALIASLSADLATRLGDPQAAEFGKAARSMATTGAMAWFLYFCYQTNWDTPIWPLRMRRPDHNTILLMLGTLVMSSIALVQVSTLSLLASRCCGKALREMAIEDRKRDQFPDF